MDKKKWNIVSGACVAVGAAGFILTGGTEAGAMSIVSGVVVLVGAGIALWKSIKG